MNRKEKYKSKIKPAGEAMKVIKNGDRVFIGGGAAQPQTLVKSLVERGKYLMDTEIVHTLTLGVSPYISPKFADIFRHNAFFISEDTRGAVAEGRADYTPIFLSDVPKIIKSGLMPIDIALIQVSPPDDHGFCSLGVSVDIVKSAAETADIVIAEVNKQMPRTLGDSLIHINDINTIVESDLPLPEWPSTKEDKVANKIGEYVATLIENGATIQTGYGNIPDAVLQSLYDKKDLGIHTEMFSDGVVDLVNEGIITCDKKT
ncbi:MAG TPA: 4-hydroxybutyrate CoA-transferase, partial [Thermoplasmata archaeon]|nr:4-hydroxybutyrate CoA-transferase [Thermoplasmata archaeon]